MKADRVKSEITTADGRGLHKKAQKSIEQALVPGELTVLALQGESGAIFATPRRILICKWGATSGAFFSVQMNSWELLNITGVEMRTGISTASIVVQSAGVVPVTKFGRMDRGAGSVWESPHALFVPKKAVTDVVASLRALVADCHASHAGATALVADPVDLLQRLGELHASGVLTDAEFAAKKADLLAQM